MKRLFLIALVFILTVTMFAKEKVEVDCTMVSNDFVKYLTEVKQEIRKETPPENTCGVFFVLKIGHNDKDLWNENSDDENAAKTPLNLKNGYDIHFTNIKDSLRKSFSTYNLGYTKNEKRTKNSYAFHDAAWQKRIVFPSSKFIIASNYSKKMFDDGKSSEYRMDEEEDENIGPTQCTFRAEMRSYWIISEPKNDISGFVNNVDDKGKKEKLKKGKVKFTRLGPNNGSEIEFEKEIKDGYYKTDPKLPSGHYKVELTEPKDCAEVIDENWIFTSGNISTKSFDVKCEENKFFTVTTSQKTTTTVKAIEKYRGIGKDLKSYQEDKDTYYIYIDAENAKIIQYHVDTKSTRKIHREKYKLNMDSCQYEIEQEDKLIKNMGAQNIFKSEDAGWGFEDDTKIYVSLPSSEDELSFTWGSLRENGRYSSSKNYKKEIPQIAKQMMGKMNDMATLFRKDSKNNKGMELWKSLYDYPGTPEHVQCGGKVAMESFLIPPLDGLQDPDIEFSINIRPSSKSEMKILKQKMNIK